MAGNAGWTDAELGWLRAHPAAGYDAFRAAGFDRSWHAFRHRRRDLGMEPARKLSAKPGDPQIAWDKAEGGKFDWRKANKLIAGMQELRGSVKRSQHFAEIAVEADKPFPVVCLSDTHVGAWSNDHALLEEVVDQILAVPDLRIVFLGDIANMAIRLRGVAEVKDDVLPPELQAEYVKSLLDDLAPRVIAACWGNHEVEREESAVGYSNLARLQAERSVYTNGIGHIDLTVGSALYRLAISHRYRWRSQLNPCHGPMQYIRQEAPSRDIAIAGDSHVPGIATWTIEGRDRVAINAGTTQTNSGYAARWFSLHTAARFPVLVLDPSVYAPRAFYSLEDYLLGREVAA